MYVGNVIIFQGNIATVLFNFQRHTKKVFSCLYSLEAEVTITEGVNYEVLQRDHLSSLVKKMLIFFTLIS